MTRTRKIVISLYILLWVAFFALIIILVNGGLL